MERAVGDWLSYVFAKELFLLLKQSPSSGTEKSLLDPLPFLFSGFALANPERSGGTGNKVGGASRNFKSAKICGICGK